MPYYLLMSSYIDPAPIVAALIGLIPATGGWVWRQGVKRERAHRSAVELMGTQLKSEIGNWAKLVVSVQQQVGAVAQDVSYLMGVKDGEDNRSMRRTKPASSDLE